MYVVHCLKEPFDIYIGRPHQKHNHLNSDPRWANPFSGKKYGRRRAIELFEQHIRKKISDGELTKDDFSEINGLVLGCWCGNKPCHGRVLIKICEEFFGKPKAMKSMLLG